MNSSPWGNPALIYLSIAGRDGLSLERYLARVLLKVSIVLGTMVRLARHHREA